MIIEPHTPLDVNYRYLCFSLYESHLISYSYMLSFVELSTLCLY